MSAYTVSCLAQDARVMQVKGDPARHRARPTPEPCAATQYPPEPVLPFTMKVPMVSNALRANCTEL